MQRRIFCPECGEQTKRTLSFEDKAHGFESRRLRVVCKCPENHGISLNGQFSAMPLLVCDHCDRQIKDGEIIHAVTIWNINREGEPGFWEKEYGVIIPDDAANVAEALSKPD